MRRRADGTRLAGSAVSRAASAVFDPLPPTARRRERTGRRSPRRRRGRPQGRPEGVASRSSSNGHCCDPRPYTLPTDTLVLACRLSGLSLTELWWDYLALGGTHSMPQLSARMTLGHEWPALEDLVLATAADEALVSGGLPPLGPSSAR
ncbi:hypothetical protein DQ240_04560 [Blastococcus sp. TF02A-26]|nr:hypothetical protein DQ240_04560 [Blastococcus sp. TF02A-26]